MAASSPERRLERGFAIVLLAGVILVVALAELVLSYRRVAVHGEAFDWAALTRATAAAFTEDGLPLFRPGAEWREVRFNALGLRGPEPVMPKPDRTIRIVFLGDSRVFAPELDLDATLPEQTLLRLRQARPHCAFDYVSLSGPGYHPALLAELWAERAARTDPDLAILMVGSVQTLLRSHDALSLPQDRLLATAAATPAAETAPAADGSGGLAGLTLFATLNRILRLSMPTLRSHDAESLPWPALDQAYDRMMSPLVTALGQTPVAAIGYRTRLRADSDLSVRRRDSRQLRLDVPGLSLDGAMALSTFVVDRMASLAAERGWDYIDTLPPLTEHAGHFRDLFHFSERGYRHIAGELADRIATRLTGDCDLR